MSDKIKVSVNLSAKKLLYVDVLKKKFPLFVRVICDPISLTSVYRYYRNSTSQKGWWEKENVSGSAFLTLHSNFTENITQQGPYKLIIINQEGTRDFILDVWSIDKIIPQEEFIMLRYKNKQNTLSTLALWCQVVKQRFEFINNVIELMNERLGNSFPCDPYQPIIPLSQVVSSSSSIISPFPTQKSSASKKLLQVIQPKGSSKESTDSMDLFTDKEITKKLIKQKIEISDNFVSPESNKSSLLKKALGVNSDGSTKTITNQSPYPLKDKATSSNGDNSMFSSPSPVSSSYPPMSYSLYSPQPTITPVGSSAANYLLNKLNTPIGSQKR